MLHTYAGFTYNTEIRIEVNIHVNSMHTKYIFKVPVNSANISLETEVLEQCITPIFRTEV